MDKNKLAVIIEMASNRFDKNQYGYRIEFGKTLDDSVSFEEFSDFLEYCKNRNSGGVMNYESYKKWQEIKDLIRKEKNVECVAFQKYMRSVYLTFNARTEKNGKPQNALHIVTEYGECYLFEDGTVLEELPKWTESQNKK